MINDGPSCKATEKLIKFAKSQLSLSKSVPQFSQTIFSDKTERCSENHFVLIKP